MTSIIVQGVSLIASLILIMLNIIGLIIGHLYENEENKNYYYINYILLGLGNLLKKQNEQNFDFKYALFENLLF